MDRRIFPICFLLLLSCTEAKKESLADSETEPRTVSNSGVSLVVLGTVQDAGSPHIACDKDCCKVLFETADAARKVVSFGLIDADARKTYLFEATPDITTQLRDLRNSANWATTDIPDGIFLTHAHVGHYTGLMYMGKEGTNTSSVPVFALPKMKNFLENNGPWDQLLSDSNIIITPMNNGHRVRLTASIIVIPLAVPHRDEYSETVGFKIIGPSKSVLFIPDIDKWSKWQKNIITEIKNVDYAFLDATFYDGEEINNRDITEIPHPFVIESLSLFDTLSIRDKQKIHFIHFNHTNPLLVNDSKASAFVLKKGFSIARKGMVLQL